MTSPGPNAFLEEAPKGSYNLEFLGIRREIRERELENQLIDKLRDFIPDRGLLAFEFGASSLHRNAGAGGGIQASGLGPGGAFQSAP